MLLWDDVVVVFVGPFVLVADMVFTNCVHVEVNNTSDSSSSIIAENVVVAAIELEVVAVVKYWSPVYSVLLKFRIKRW